MTTHPESRRLTRALARAARKTVGFHGVVYRSASPRFASQGEIIAGSGARVVGGRWNPPRAFATVYLSLDPHAALDEALSHFRRFGLPLEKAMPRTFVAVAADLHRVFNLTDRSVLQTLRLSRRKLTVEPWWEIQSAGGEALTQALGRIGYEQGVEGLLAPSAARADGTNLVVFPGNLGPTSKLIVLSAGELSPPWS